MVFWRFELQFYVTGQELWLQPAGIVQVARSISGIYSCMHVLE